MKKIVKQILKKKRIKEYILSNYRSAQFCTQQTQNILTCAKKYIAKEKTTYANNAVLQFSSACISITDALPTYSLTLIVSQFDHAHRVSAVTNTI